MMEDQEFRTTRKKIEALAAAAGDSDERKLHNLVQVKTDRTRKIGWYRHDDLQLLPGDRVVVETERGTAGGVILTHPTKKAISSRGLRNVLRLMPGASKDWQQQRTQERESNAREVCVSLVKRYHLDMKLVETEYVPWENRTIFYFTADGRIDFRELVKELSRTLRCRIEMRQIGPRDETKMLGGLGRCGREHCCSGHLREFKSVRTKMAKEQGLVVNQEKITGQCRKLLCCLAYEKEVYEMLKADMPAVGTSVLTPEGMGEVVELRILQQAVKTRLKDTAAYKVFPIDHLGEKAKAAREAAEAAARAEVEAAQYRPSDRKEGGRGRRRGESEGRGGKKAEGDSAGRKPRRDRKRRPKKKGEQGGGGQPKQAGAQGGGGGGKPKPRREGESSGGRSRRRRRRRSSGNKPPENK